MGVLGRLCGEPSRPCDSPSLEVLRHPACLITQAQIEEVKTVADAMKEGAANVLGPNGAKIAGVKYKFIKADENTAYVKLVLPSVQTRSVPARLARARGRQLEACDSRDVCLLLVQESCGVVFAKCNTCILVGRHGDPFCSLALSRPAHSSHYT